jgi:hypothetical protein
MANEDFTSGYPRNPDFVLEYRARRFYLSVVSDKAKKFLSAGFPMVDRDATSQIGDLFALNLMEQAYWRNLRVRLVVMASEGRAS